MVLDTGIEVLAQVLLGLEFRAIDEFESFVTFGRVGDPLKIHVGPDASFAVFNGDDELIAEGKGQDDLYRALMTKMLIVPAQKRPASRRTHRPKHSAADTFYRK